jgi:hypothetical protein
VCFLNNINLDPDNLNRTHVNMVGGLSEECVTLLI